MKLYQYVGPQEAVDSVRGKTVGRLVRSPEDVIEWMVHDYEMNEESEGVVAAFVIDADGELRIADPHSEHVACVGGAPVRFAGELTFVIHNESVLVIDVTNRATGYCPEPEAWPAVHAALLAAGLQPPHGLRQACVFRRCPRCDHLNLVKDRVYICALCASALPLMYNVQA